ncbi:MAG: hemagglutinin repeat-containing protein, partial [Azovibrio sp.]|nr:hemagglutinin repeat-containing protein [Azovibrio sp.]
KLNGDLNNYKGTIEIAGQTFIRSTGSVLNAEGIFNSGKVALSLVGGVKSSSGEVQASLTATDGDMLILAGQDVTLHDTLFNATGGLKVDTKGTLDMLGIQASAGGNMVLSAAGGVNVSGKSNIQDEWSVTSQGKGKKATTETVSDYAEQATTASLNAGGSLVVSSAKDISLNSVTGKGTHLVFDAGGKLEIDGLRDTQYHSVSTLTGNNLQTAKSELTDEARNKHLGSTFVGDSLQLKAGEDIKVVGSKFAITGSGTLNAGGSIQLDAASETFNAENVTIKDGKTRTSTSSSVSYVGSAIDVGGSLQATAGKSLSVTGSSLSSGGTMLVKAGEDISLSSQLGSSITQEGKNTETSTTRVQALLDSAGGLTLEGGGNVTLMGAELQAEETLRLTVGQDLTTVGSTFEAKNVHLAVGNNLFDINGKVTASEDILVVAEHNLALHQDGQDTQLNYSAGQDLKLYSKQDMSLYNVDLSAGRDLVADAAGKLDITARSDSTSTKTGKWGRISDTHWSVSELQAGRDLSLKSGSDLQLQGAKLQAQGDITVAAEGKMEWLAVADRHGQDDLARAPSVGNLFGKAGASNQGSLSWQDVSLDAGGKVDVSAGGDVTAEGGRVRAGTDLQIVMGGQGNFKSLVSGEQSHLAGGTAYFSNRELSEDQASFASQAKGFMGEAGGNLTIVSQDSMDMEAVSLKAGQDLALGAMKNLTLSAAFEESEQETEESLKSWSRSDELFPWGAEDEEKRAGNSSYEKRVVGNQLQAGGNLILAAGEALALVATDGKGKDITLYGGTNLAVSGAYGEIGAETRENNVLYGFGENEARDPRYLVEQSGSTNFIGSQLTGENLNVYSGGDAKLMGSRFELSGNAKIVAEKTLELGAAQENSAGNRNGTPFLYSFKGNVAGSQSLNWSGTQLHARGTVDLESGGDLSVLGSQVSAGGSLTAKSKGSLKVGSLLNVEQDSQFWGRQDYRSELAAAGLTSGGTLRLSAEGDIGLNGVRVASGAELLAHAGKDLYLGNLRTDNQDWWRNNDEKYEVSKLTAVGNVELEAEHDLLASGGSIRSGEGNVLLDGAHKIELASVTDQKVRINSKSSGSFFTKDTTTTKVTGTVHGVEIETGGAGKLTFRSEGDVRLESTDLDVGRGGVEVDIGGKLTLAMASDSYQKVTQKSSEWVVWQKQSVDGKREVTGVENQLTSTGPIVIKAAGGMDIEYAQRRGESVEDALARAQGSSWAKGITPDLEVSWKASPDKKKTWHSSQQGLTQVGAAIVAVFSGVYGFEFYSQAVGYTSTMTTAAGTTVTTVTGTTLQGATAAGLTGATTDALVQLGTTGKIDGDNVLRTGIMSFATFGVTNAKLWGADGSQSLNDLAGIKSNSGTLDIAKEGFLENLSGEQLLALGGRSLVKAGLEHAIYGTDLGDSFKGGLASDLGALLAKDIGDKWGNGDDFGMKTLAHMGLGATMAELAGRDPAAGGLGGLIENVLDNATHSAGLKIDPDNPGDRSLYTATSIFGAGLAADLLGMDTNAATIAAQNAAENNRLL